MPCPPWPASCACCRLSVSSKQGTGCCCASDGRATSRTQPTFPLFLLIAASHSHSTPSLVFPAKFRSLETLPSKIVSFPRPAAARDERDIGSSSTHDRKPAKTNDVSRARSPASLRGKRRRSAQRHSFSFDERGAHCIPQLLAVLDSIDPLSVLPSTCVAFSRRLPAPVRSTIRHFPLPTERRQRPSESKATRPTSRGAQSFAAAPASR